jgi:predicted RNA-binding protein with TRAM domain
MKKEFLPKKPIEIGDEFTVDFIKNQKGGKPICRIEGIVCFLDNSIKDFVTPCSSWVVTITHINEKCMVVKPLLKIRTPKENQVIFNERIESLRTDSLRTHKANTSKVIKGHQYMSFAELQEERIKKIIIESDID